MEPSISSPDLVGRESKIRFRRDGTVDKTCKILIVVSARISSNKVAGARACWYRTMADHGALNAPGSSTVKVT
jgi:hypothetical protein